MSDVGIRHSLSCSSKGISHRRLTRVASGPRQWLAYRSSHGTLVKEDNKEHNEWRSSMTILQEQVVRMCMSD